ncbi:tyrosine-type recombinase/integrase [Paraburkholderia metrosideri]|uniref:Tyrosine recombinase XerC n=1 Tax=Paraburkholderia metrosideri TaxID=580937 RepID=A0ABN7I572_9BURK|nr:tyrosine-type recombinase/integrase [Paraburkholderia metrosideri]CAD6553485.1 Tyrosine recombinase XerC [Paraburkholderia metrosideri]
MSRNKVTITREFLRGLSANGKFQEYADAELTGFKVRVLPSGTVQYTVKFYKPDGKEGRKRIGTYPAMSASDAREAARLELTQTPTKQDTPAVVEEKKKRRAESVRRAHGVPTLRTFLDGDYTAYLEANEISTANAALIRSSFPDLLDRGLDEFTPWMLEQWKSRAAKTGIKPKTISNKLVALQGLLRVAVKAGHVTDNPAKEVPRNGKADVVVRYLGQRDPLERERLYVAMEVREEVNRDARHRTNAHRRSRPGGALKPLPSLRNVRYTDHLQPLVVTALNTGMRKAELLALQWDDVDLELRTIHVRRAVAKSDKRRDIPISDELLACLKTWKPLAHRLYVFGNPETDAPLTDFKNAWAALLVAAEIADFRFHDTRHDFATRLVAQGVDLYKVKTLLGHSSYAMVERYAHHHPDHLHAAIDAAFNEPRRAKPKRAPRKASAA